MLVDYWQIKSDSAVAMFGRSEWKTWKGISLKHCGLYIEFLIVDGFSSATADRVPNKHDCLGSLSFGSQASWSTGGCTFMARRRKLHGRLVEE